jgi:hypothetical protein
MDPLEPWWWDSADIDVKYRVPMCWLVVTNFPKHEVDRKYSTVDRIDKFYTTSISYYYSNYMNICPKIEK